MKSVIKTETYGKIRSKEIDEFTDWIEDMDLELEFDVWQVRNEDDIRTVYTITNKYDRSVGIPRVEVSPNFDTIEELYEWWKKKGKNMQIEVI